jgi:hypothetical protein
MNQLIVCPILSFGYCSKSIKNSYDNSGTIRLAYSIQENPDIKNPPFLTEMEGII